MGSSRLAFGLSLLSLSLPRLAFGLSALTLRLPWLPFEIPGLTLLPVWAFLLSHLSLGLPWLGFKLTWLLPGGFRGRVLRFAWLGFDTGRDPSACGTGFAKRLAR